MLPSIEEARPPRLPPVIIRTKERLVRHNRIQGCRGKRGLISRIVFDDCVDPASDRGQDKEEAVDLSIAKPVRGEITSPERSAEPPQKRRQAGQWEVRNADGKLKGSEVRRSVRQRKPPERYGF